MQGTFAIRCLSSTANATSLAYESGSGAKFTLPDDLHPQFVNGKWNKPKISAMTRKRLRKEVLAAGRELFRLLFVEDIWGYAELQCLIIINFISLWI